MYPRVIVDIKKLGENFKNIKRYLAPNIDFFPVVKVVAGDLTIVKSLIDAGAKYIADSRVKNLKSFSGLKVKKVLLRIPMLSEVEDVIKYADVSFNSEMDVIIKLNQAAQRANIVHDIIVMIDMGDLREGYYFKDQKLILDTFAKIYKLENINALGIGTNITCYGGVLPSNKNMSQLVSIKDSIEKEFDKTVQIISGGNSSSFDILYEGKMPVDVNNLRIGEALFLGKETVSGKTINEKKYPGWEYPLNDDVFILEAEIIELKEKDSLPIGEIGLNSFGEVPVIIDKGKMMRGIAAIGKQDTHHSTIKPLDKNVSIVDSSSDHLLLDFTKAPYYKIGDVIKFSLTYASLVSTFVSPYVEIVYVNE